MRAGLITPTHLFIARYTISNFLMSLYFAYGSNMDETQMRERCPESTLLGTATLHAHRLVFTIPSRKWGGGCADIVPDQNAEIYGVLYELSDADFAALDKKEGVFTKSYRRVSVMVERESEMVRADTYEVVSKTEGLAPSMPYISQIVRAAERFSFPDSYLVYLRSFTST